MASRSGRERFFSRFVRRRRIGRDDLHTGPIRGELLGSEHLADRARELARSQRLARTGDRRRGAPLLERLDGTRRVLVDAHARVAAAADRAVDVGPPGEWLLDNFHVIEEHIREVRETLPRGFYRELPKLAAGRLAGYPRIYELAITLISHTEGRIDDANLSLFTSAFQEVEALGIGELWAIPAMLRLGLIESVRRMALRVVHHLDDVEAADAWADRLLDASESGDAAAGEALEKFVNETPPLGPVFVARFLRRLRLGGRSFAPLGWLEPWIADEALSGEDAAARSTQRVAITQLVLANSITSLRDIARLDWPGFVERQSAMERVLREDPSGFYARMTFITRDRYRHVVERIARRSDRTEEEVAREAVGLAAGRDAAVAPRSHIGYWLIDEGRTVLEDVAGYRPAVGEAVHRWVVRHPTVVFFGGLVIATTLTLLTLLALGGPAARVSWPLVVLFGLLPASEIAVGVVNQLIVAFLPPRILPKLDLARSGIPPELATAVVIPTLFGGPDAVAEAVETIEIHFLANREANLHFAILGDFTDAATETVDGDDAIIAAAVAGVRELNARYATGGVDRFYLFHRPRRWNAKQGVWMGWERKRGKLSDFNRFLRGLAPGAFSTIVGDVEAIRRVRYVITLDADTVLPPDSATLLIGAMAHPLNAADYDEDRARVGRGYGILQPRVGVSLPSAHRSRFAMIHSGHPGVDPYTTAVSDVYQDLFGEGSFTGKGIYDVDAFEVATRGRFPENTLLSHDLIEGNYARAGLVTDITVYDDYPASYLAFTRRKHRWIRGDWQLLRWLTGRVPGPDGDEPNRLAPLSRWKIFDNLRRSTVEIALVAFIVAGWTLFAGSPLRWTLIALAALAVPWVVSLLLAAMRPPLDKSWRAYYAAVGQDAVTSVQQMALAVAFLAHQAWISADAIVRTLWRLAISRRNLLEWQTAKHTERAIGAGRLAVWRQMWPATALTLAIIGIVAAVHQGGGPGAPSPAAFSPTRGAELAFAVIPFALLWLTAPALAHALSAAPVRRERRLPRGTRTAALRYALLHWRYFDRFVGTETNWLAPDNFQEVPSAVLALRTSPTNIGLQLLSTVSAYDLGFLTVDEMTRRLELAFRSMERMRRFRGHLYNWYDLRDLRVLEPGYISTVDSGNLAGHLLALRQACLEIAGDPVFDGRVWRALEAAVAVATERLVTAGSARAGDPARALLPQMRRALNTAAVELKVAREALAEAHHADPAAAFGVVAGALQQARGALAGTAFPPEEMSAATEWIDWSLRRIAEYRSALVGVPGHLVTARSGEAVVAFPTLAEVAEHSVDAAHTVRRLGALADRAADLAGEMDFRFLYDERRELFSIGYRETSHSLDPSYYDLLASEARLASFLAVAKDGVPVDHWFHLGRTLTRAAGATALVSWSGSMFEYLMPALVMRSLPYTVLDESYRAVVRRQIAYAERYDVPWGISESAYNLRDRHLTYQYRAFGVPDLALKRGLGRDLVVAPYASALAAMIDAPRAVANLSALERSGALGPYGFRDAIDYTRPDPGHRLSIVRTYMAHHVGMTIVALTNALADRPWPRRFHADPWVRSAELLLDERVPRRLVLQGAQRTRREAPLPNPDLDRPAVRHLHSTDTPQPHIALLGRPPYTMMVSHCGGGYGRYDRLAVTRWRSDGTVDNTGQFCYLKDVDRGRAWSAAHQPVCAPAEWYEAQLATDRVTFDRADDGIETRTEIVAVPEDSAEVRRVTVTNTRREPREIEITSYGEIVLAPPEADRQHPAFGNLFVETEWHAWCTAITAARRPRSSDEPPLWCVHVVDRGGEERVGTTSCETDRGRFIGRGRTTRDPVALERDGPLSGTTGAVLDPIFALRVRVRLEPGRSASVAFTTLVATTREQVFALADRYHDPHASRRALDLAWTSTQVELRELDVTPADAAVFQELAGYLLYSNPNLRAPQGAALRQTAGSQPLLWSTGISGDWPILLATIDESDGLPTLRQLFTAHNYWRRRGMTVDLVVLNQMPTGYFQELHDRIMSVMVATSDFALVDRPGGVFVRRRDQLGDDVAEMIAATARVHVECAGQSLGRIIDALQTPATRDEERASLPTRAPGRAAAEPRRIRRVVEETAVREPEPSVRSSNGGALHRGDGSSPPLDNGYGRLLANGDYEIRVREDHVPPAPWANVIANERAGFYVTERGATCTWVGNAQFYRLSPWHNDPVSDPVSEVVYLRDAETGEVWCPTPAPLRAAGDYTVRHSAGVTTFEHRRGEIETLLTLGMAGDEPVKLSILRVTNHDDRAHRLTLTSYVEWTLGVLREHTQHQVRTEQDVERGAIRARNFFNPEFAGHIAFCALSERLAGFTADRGEFLGRNGAVSDPAAMRAPVTLSGATGGGIDPCAALRCELSLDAGETRDVVIVLGAAESEGDATRMIAEFRDPVRAARALAASVGGWAYRLSAITVRTPNPSFDAMLNRWTLYQTLSCRMWGRAAVYQSSGAFGFRDQLQDAMALVYAEPGLARAHILRAAARQFVEGDVQHWWHPPNGRGVRTRFSDDLAWLPYVVDHYVRVTGDAAVLDEEVPFLTMRSLAPHEHEIYDLPTVAGETASLYEHCLRALHRASTAGERGLPLIGTGDWNDGMNRVGVEGRGESVWLAWFLIATLRAFADLAEGRRDGATARQLRAGAVAYVDAVEAQAWDGEWYRRAWFDDGTPLGSAANDECQIDSIAQSWSVISHAGDPTRQRWALRSVEKRLVREEDRLIALLTPPFDRTPNDPGYIKGYVPGVRENGAQYTHAALWVVLATAMHGDGDRAVELFQMLNPLTHARTPDEAATYRVEPYVVAADVYTAEGQLGRGGWTWYTGSASWMYRVGLEGILGVHKRGDSLAIDPCIPTAWPEYRIDYRYGSSLYEIVVRNPDGISCGAVEVTLDGRALERREIPLVDDGSRHEVSVRLGAEAGISVSPGA